MLLDSRPGLAAALLGVALGAVASPAAAQPTVPPPAAGGMGGAASPSSARPGACPGCGVVLSVERRQGRARWSSIVGTPAAEATGVDLLERAGRPSSMGSPLSPAAGAAGSATSTGAAPGAVMPGSAAPGGRPPPGATATAGARGADGMAARAGSDPTRAARRPPDTAAALPASPYDPPAGAARAGSPRAPGGADEPAPLDMPARTSMDTGGAPSRRGWSVVVRLDDGSTQTLEFDNEPSLQPGDRIRLRGSQLWLR